MRVFNAHVVNANITNDLGLTTLLFLLRQRPELRQLDHNGTALYVGSRRVLEVALLELTNDYTRQARAVLPLGLPSNITPNTPQAERHYVQAVIYAESMVDGLTGMFPDATLMHELRNALAAVLRHRILETRQHNADSAYRLALVAAMGQVSQRVTEMLDRAAREAGQPMGDRR